MLENSQFHCLADAYLDALLDEVEAKDAKAQVDTDLQEGILTLSLSDNSLHYLISKHAPSKQIWLSSPVSGGLHFSYNEAHSAWELADGTCLSTLLASELKQKTGIEFRFAV
jgi:frataxin